MQHIIFFWGGGWGVIFGLFWYLCYYLHMLSDSVFPIHRIFVRDYFSNTTTDSKTYPLRYGDHMVNLFFAFIGNTWIFIARQNQAIWDASFYLV